MTEQAITQEQLFLALLQFIADNGGEVDRQHDNLMDALADRLGLTDEERARSTEGGRPQWQSTVEWSREKLIERYSAIERPEGPEGYGMWRLTQEGWRLVLDPPTEMLEEFTTWRVGRLRTRPENAPPPPAKPSGHFETRLEQMRESLQRSTQVRARTKRNGALARALKEEYEYRCQLCDPDEPACPRISMNNGKFYVEVHHLFGLAEAVEKYEHGQLDDTEYANLGSYHNVVVVCPYHHRLLHHHSPAFEFDRSRCAFVSVDGLSELFVTLRHPPHLERD